ncbi:MAG: tetratricopeptide repeat protein [Acidobacteria bacterium]|nr:tetratricopeptide repeat protein [Acidobacteriota bacterium]
MTRTIALIICCLAALLGGACRGDAPPRATNRQAANASDGQTGQPVDPAKLDAEIAQLEAQAAKHPDDRLMRETLADALVKRGQLHYDARRLNEALADYQAALSHNPDHEEAQTRIAQINNEMQPEPVGDDGKPVTVPAKPGGNTNDE